MQSRVIDRGWNRIHDEIRRSKGSYTKVGFLQDGVVASPVYEGSGHRAITDMGTLVKIAMTHEYGGGNNIPQRSFFRSAFDENLDRIHQMQRSELAKIYDGKSTVAVSLARLGEFVVAKIKAKIRSNIPPPLKEATVKRKGSRRTLIDRGQLINSVQHAEVVR